MKKLLIFVLLTLSLPLYAATTYSGPFKADGTNLPPAAVTKNYTSLATMNALVVFRNGITVSNNITNTGVFTGSTVNATVASTNRLYFGDGTSMTTAPGVSGGAGPSSTGNIAFFNAASTVTGNTNLYWDNTNSRLGINTITPSASIALVSGNVIFKSTQGSGEIIDFPGVADGVTSAFWWDGYKGAIRAGYPSSTSWSNANVGVHSTAFGYNAIASGSKSFAAGSAPNASGQDSIALGTSTSASGSNAKSLSSSSTSSGVYSTTIGGSDLTAFQYMATVIGGRYNALNTGGDSSAWVSTDPLFMIANGSGTSARSNALVVLKNGNVGIGLVTATPNNALEVSGNVKVTNGNVQITVASLTYADPLTWNLATQSTAKVTLTGNTTINAPTNMVDGQTYVLRITQDGTGGRTATWNAVYKWPGGVTPNLTASANAVDVVTFTSDGTNMYGVISKDFR